LPAAEHPEYGIVHRLRLDLFDCSHLAAVSSPFLRLLKAQRKPYSTTNTIHTAMSS
jgi:hypothetical protein